MPTGFFIVSPLGTPPKEIEFATDPTQSGPPPEDQLALKSDVERTLTTIQILYDEKTDQASFDQAYTALISLAQCGLVGPYAQPEVAKRALSSLQSEIVLREGGRVKNRYLRVLGLYCFVMLIPAIITSIQSIRIVSLELFCFSLLWAGAMIGAWLSFAYRKTLITFSDLTLLEEDRLEPPFRLLVAGFLTVLLGMVFLKQAVTVDVGPLSTKDIGTDGVVSFLIGAMCGFSEQVLPSQFARHASRLFEAR